MKPFGFDVCVTLLGRDVGREADGDKKDLHSGVESGILDKLGRSRSSLNFVFDR
jgi:hypothetical protein